MGACHEGKLPRFMVPLVLERLPLGEYTKKIIV